MLLAAREGVGSRGVAFCCPRPRLSGSLVWVGRAIGPAGAWVGADDPRAKRG